MSIAEAEALEEDSETLAARGGQQIGADNDGTEQFADKTEHGDASKKFGAADVERGRDDDESNCNDDKFYLTRIDPQKLGKEGSTTYCNACDGGAQGPEIDPTRSPGPALAD